ncbi:MAG: hypothetical protein LV479_08665 [Methylacidiphilales bacterium]|nr:hypothetical protein [Candidatus Methylacidiphilales bacterium]
MNRAQAAQLGEALIAWSRGYEIEVCDGSKGHESWRPFEPESYEALNVDEALEWRVAAWSRILS